jgi:hypothetical protein
MIDVMEFRKQMRVKTTTAPQWMTDMVRYTYHAFAATPAPNYRQILIKHMYHASPYRSPRSLMSLRGL